MHGEEVEKWEKLKGSFIGVSRRIVRARVDLLMNPVNGCVCVCVCVCVRERERDKRCCGRCLSQSTDYEL